jgi:hypothetical protein
MSYEPPEALEVGSTSHFYLGECMKKMVPATERTIVEIYNFAERQD